MTSIPQAAQDHYATMQRLQVLAIAAGRRSWRRVDSRFISESWTEALRDLTPAIAAIQVRSASAGSSYGALTLAEQGLWVAPEAFVDPQAFGGYAADGRSLDGLLYSPVTAVKAKVGGGMAVSLAMEQGRSLLETIVRTTVADAGRQAASVDIAARKNVGYVRMLNPPSCSRCTVLAGKFFRWNAGFLRHPKCDCVHVMSAAGSTQAARDEGLIDDPYEYFKGLSEAEQNKAFGRGQAQAIRDGADISQVVNSARGTRGAFTTEGTTRRGYAKGVLRPGQRRMAPDTIYRLNPDRADALKALRDQGYILPGGQNPLGSIVGQREGFGALGRGGTRKAASQAVLDARVTGVRDGSRYTMTEAERRMHDAEQRWRMVQQGRNPYSSPGFGNTQDPLGLRLNTVGAGSAPLTPTISAQVESDYRRRLATSGEVFTK